MNPGSQFAIHNSQFFSPDYVTARARFRDATDAAGWTADAREVEARGPGGERLSIDAAVLPNASSATLVVSSGLHGIEGFFGSAVQLALIDRWRRDPPSCRVVLVHALNPYGFAWLRRTDELNVDLNRNFLTDPGAFSGAPPGYAALDAVLNPSSQRAGAKGGRRPRLPLWLELLPAIMRRGPAAIRRTIAEGQYDFPRGLFFGGRAASPVRRLIEEAWSDWLRDAEDVLHLDVHTGLGKRGAATLLLDHEPSASQRERLDAVFGPGAYETPGTAGHAYTARGGFGAWCTSRRLVREYVFAYAEFGTASQLRVLDGLRAENAAHHSAPPSDARAIRAKDRLKDLFCPPDDEWRRRALDAAVQLAARAASGATIFSSSSANSARR